MEQRVPCTITVFTASVGFNWALGPWMVINGDVLINYAGSVFGFAARIRREGLYKVSHLKLPFD